MQVLIISIKSKRPDVQVNFGTESSPFIERLVMNEKVDLGLITNATSSPQLIVEPFQQEEMVVIISTRQPLARRHELTMSESRRGTRIKAWTFISQPRRTRDQDGRIKGHSSSSSRSQEAYSIAHHIQGSKAAFAGHSGPT